MSRDGGHGSGAAGAAASTRHLPLHPLPPCVDRDPGVRTVLASVRDAIVATAGRSLTGLYLHGSLITGGFDPNVSDLDLIAVLTGDAGAALTLELEAMHERLKARHPSWSDRIEAVYVAANQLTRFREDVVRLAVISPGEPFHVVRGGRDWILTWYPAREDGVALAGPPTDAVIPAIALEEFMVALRDHVLGARAWLRPGTDRAEVAYAVLTVCRGLYTLRFGSRPSKARAAAWAIVTFPTWTELIERALRWRTQRFGVRAGARARATAGRFIEAVTSGLASP